MKRFAVLVAVALAAGCASLQDQYPSPRARECAEWYQALDEATDAAGVRDAQYSRVAGFPYLRVDRMLASLRGRAAANEAALIARKPRPESTSGSRNALSRHQVRRPADAFRARMPP